MLDAGADKPLAFLPEAHEENPALGRRGIRALRDAEQVLRDQLQALAEASAQSEADLWVMAPMVADVEETEYFVVARPRIRPEDGRHHRRGARSRPSSPTRSPNAPTS